MHLNYFITSIIEYSRNQLLFSYDCGSILGQLRIRILLLKSLPYSANRRTRSRFMRFWNRFKTLYSKWPIRYTWDKLCVSIFSLYQTIYNKYRIHEIKYAFHKHFASHLKKNNVKGFRVEDQVFLYVCFLKDNACKQGCCLLL